MTDESGEEGRFYDTIEQAPGWKSYLYRLQQKAPKPRRIVCSKEIQNKPAHYGKEFHGCISREEADDLVSEADGCYLVREAHRLPGSYTLTMRFGGTSKNFRLYYNGLHYVGEKRFQTIQDLVADGLITMYIDTYAKDYVDTMMISPTKTEEKKDVGKETKENEPTKEAVDEADATEKNQGDHRFSVGKRQSVKPSAYKKSHNFKMNTFKGPHRCDYCRNFLWGLIMQGVKCQDCGFKAHKQCSGVVPPTCKPDKKYIRRGNTLKGTKTEEKSVVPSEINLRGPLALEAYNKALTEGKARVKRVPIMLIGQDHSGKTSLKNSLMGKPFNKDGDSTLGIDVDPSYFKVSSEIWRPEENDQATNDIEATSFEHRVARLVADELKEEKNKTKSVRSENIELKKDSSLDVSSSSNSNAAELPVESAPSSEESRDATESIHTSKDPNVDVRERVPETSSDPTQRREEHSTLRMIPEEVAILIKKLIKEVEKMPDEEEIYSVLWDFGGQSVYYTTHPLFITTRAMYLLVYDLSRDPFAVAEPVAKQGKYQEILDNHGGKSNLDYLNFWMTSIASLASQDEDQYVRSDRVLVNTPPVFLVCTHADKPFGGANPLALARKVFGFLQTKPYRNQLYNDVFVVDNTKSGTESECSEVIRLRENVLAIAKELPQMKEPIPIKWLKYEKALQVTVKEEHKWISFETAKQIALEVCQIDDEKELSTLLDFLHDQRSLIHFDDTTVLNNMVVLDPQWLVDVFKKVITVKPCHQQEKEFEELWSRLECKGILEQKLLEHVWSSLLDKQKTSASLIEIMEKFSLLCPLPSSDASCDKRYLVPSMLRSLPPQDVIKLVDSAQIPSLFFKFESEQVPPGLFPRLVLQLFQWGQDEFWSSENPDLYHGFARFYTLADAKCSVILLCHSSSIEVAVHRDIHGVDLAESLHSKLNNSADAHYDGFEVACARTVRRQLGLMLECMRKEFCWLKNMRYEVGVMCPICCQGRVAKYNCMHSQQGCKQEECLHFRCESELRKHSIRCRSFALAQFNEVPVKKIAPWIETPDEQLTIVEREGRLLPPEEGNDEKLLALPSKDLESLLSQPCDSKEVVLKLKDCLQLDQASLERPDPGTKRLIRCLARKVKQSNRLDVFNHLRDITPAGTTGPLLPECQDIRQVPFDQMRDLTITLSGGDEWKVLAVELGLKQHEIRYLDNHRIRNPCDALLAHIANQGYISVGFLYNTLIKCKFPVVADLL